MLFDFFCGVVPPTFGLAKTTSVLWTDKTGIIGNFFKLAAGNDNLLLYCNE
jgi:hypothetical protein